MGPYYDTISLMIERLPEPHQTPAARFRGHIAEAPPATPRRPWLAALRKALWSLVTSPLRSQRRYARS